ncbi:carboxypeptidase-like regulatory domain-containing protein [Prevotella sp. 10(H)]|uniref:carboxypeptidase-like regulatory domain-containing protein n=1 Tax=Prevotella sp. 10(H) TaxID=1158294 RepID=UPI0004A73BA4|nr:carboxypeptidase-like regulatory domain-containing protein [Prevotella sp. 10(H)]
MKNAILFVSLFFFTFSLNAQQKKITGIVTNNSGETLIGVNIRVKGTNNGIITNIDGEYELWASAEDILQFSYIGYLSQETVVGNRDQINIRLEEYYDDLGLPTEYYHGGNISGSAQATYTGKTFGYAFDVRSTFPYWWSSRKNDYITFYDKIKGRSSFGFKMAKTDPSVDNWKVSLSLQANVLNRLIEFDRLLYIRPYLYAGIYLDTYDKQIKSQNLEYGGGVDIKIDRRWTYIFSFTAGYQGFTRRHESNNFFLGIRVTPRPIPVIYY